MDRQAITALYRFASTHHGIFVTADARRCGVHSDALERLCRSGHVERIVVGVYRIPGAPRTYPQRLTIACAAYGAVAARRSAAALHDLEGIRFRGIEIATERTPSRAIPGVIVHSRRAIPEEHVTTGKGVPCTSPAWTVCSLASVVRYPVLRIALEDAIRRRLTNPDVLGALLPMFTGQGHKGADRLRRALAACVPGEPTDSQLEVLFELLMEEYALPRPVRHLNVAGVGELDYAYPAYGVAFETSGWHRHWEPARFYRDAEKSLRAYRRGWHVHTLTWPMVMEPAVTAESMAALIKAGPGPVEVPKAG